MDEKRITITQVHQIVYLVMAWLFLIAHFVVLGLASSSIHKTVAMASLLFAAVLNLILLILSYKED